MLRQRRSMLGIRWNRRCDSLGIGGEATARGPKPPPRDGLDRTTPWEQFHHDAEWLGILEPHGSTSHDGEILTRPNQTAQGALIAVVRRAEDDNAVLIASSMKAGVLSNEGSHRAFSKFDAFKLVNHDGNDNADARSVLSSAAGGAA